MSHIVAIGGGELLEKETLSIDREIVALTGKPRPKALFIATASGEPQSYIGTFSATYANVLRCRVGTLRLLTANLSDAEIAVKILSADLIYVGGGNTKVMMDVWQCRGIGPLLKQAHEQGTILSGLSAGAICWFAGGHSDSVLDETGEYIAVSGLGFLPWFQIPHYNERPDADAFLVANNIAETVALDNCAAIHVRDDRFRILKSDPAATARAIRCRDGALTKKTLDNADFLPLSQLFDF